MNEASNAHKIIKLLKNRGLTDEEKSAIIKELGRSLFAQHERTIRFEGRKMLKIAIVEDDKEYQKLLSSYLNRYQAEYEEKLVYSAFNDGLDFLENKEVFDVVLMDIEMPFMDGLNVAKKFREKDSNAVIIFVTNMLQYAVNGYEVDAIGFLVKPIGYLALSLLLQKASRRIQAFAPKEIMIVSNNRQRRVLIGDIYYVEVNRYQVIYHLKSGTEVVNDRFYNVVKQLSEYPFAECNQCYLVNLQHVTSLDGDFIVCGGDTLKMSRRKKAEFVKKLTEFMGGSKYKWN